MLDRKKSAYLTVFGDFAKRESLYIDFFLLLAKSIGLSVPTRYP